MDYCSTCQRHLNGALVCPGCGGYAPDIALPGVAGRDAAGRATPTGKPTAYAAGAKDEADRTATDRTAAERTAAERTAAEPEIPEAAQPLPEGRAARRRQRARWRKSQRRAMVATTFALVGGGMAIGAVGHSGGDQTLASTAPPTPGMDGEQEGDEQQLVAHVRSSAANPHGGQQGTFQGAAGQSTPEVPRQRHAVDPSHATPPGAPTAAPARTTATDGAQQLAAAVQAPADTMPAHSAPQTAQTAQTTQPPPSAPAPEAESTGGGLLSTTTDAVVGTLTDTTATVTGTLTDTTEAVTSAVVSTDPEQGTTATDETCLLVLCVGD
ncbi:SCO2400 family protein [Streptomyces sp. O3]